MKTGPKPKEPRDRFWAKVLIGTSEACWNWNAAITERGYGTFSVYINKTLGIRKTIGAHRFAYIDTYGGIPDDLVVDHLCENKRCCNPAHLEAVTQGENARRWFANRTPRTHCQRGHEFTPENTRQQHGGRMCKTCQRAAERRWKAARRISAGSQT